MGKNVTVWLKNGDKRDYQNLSSFEEDCKSGNETAIRLYKGGKLGAVLSYEQIQRLEVVGQT